MNLTAKELPQLFESHKVKLDPESTAKYGRDWTTYYKINCSAVVFPESTQDVQKLVLWARKNKIKLVPSGGRTGLSGAACAIGGEVVVNFERMSKIKSFNAEENSVVVEAGVITEQLQKYAEDKGLFYPVDFASRGSSHIGGNIATNAGGIKVLRYGMTRNWVLGLKVVTGSGEIMEFNHGLIKNATGYDFRHLFIGSEGTLGFVTEATMGLCNPPKKSSVLVLGVNELSSIMKIFSEFRKNMQISAFEMFSELALVKVIEQTQLPRAFSTITNYYVLIEADSDSETAENQILKCFETCTESGWASDGALSQSDTQAKNFWRLREDISEATAKYTPYKNDISVSVSHAPSFMKDLDAVFKQAYPNWEVVWFGHVGDGNLHINILRPPQLDHAKFLKDCQKVDELVFEVVKNYKGAISAEHGVGLSKKNYLNYSRTENEINLMRSIKRIFDPDNIINPGKIFDQSS